MAHHLWPPSRAGLEGALFGRKNPRWEYDGNMGVFWGLRMKWNFSTKKVTFNIEQAEYKTARLP